MENCKYCGIVKEEIDKDPTKSLFQICEERKVTGVSKCRHALEKYRRHKLSESAPVECDVEVTWIHGKTGCGKTRYVYDKEPKVYTMMTWGRRGWFCLYHGQDAILFDDLRPKYFKNKRLFLQLLDRYRVQVRIGGELVFVRPKRVYITTLYPIDHFTRLFNEPQQLLRLITTHKTM